jgi:hypothetical protein
MRLKGLAEAVKQRKTLKIFGGNLVYCATLIKKKIKFSSYREIQSGAVAKSYMRKGFLIYEEMCKYFPIYSMRRPLVINDFATAPF